MAYAVIALILWVPATAIAYRTLTNGMRDLDTFETGSGWVVAALLGAIGAGLWPLTFIALVVVLGAKRLISWWDRRTDALKERPR